MMNCIPGVNPIIKISENCNFRCRYCYFEKFNENPAHQYMDESLVLSIIKQAINYNNLINKKIHSQISLILDRIKYL